MRLNAAGRCINARTHRLLILLTLMSFCRVYDDGVQLHVSVGMKSRPMHARARGRGRCQRKGFIGRKRKREDHCSRRQVRKIMEKGICAAARSVHLPALHTKSIKCNWRWPNAHHAFVRHHYTYIIKLCSRGETADASVVSMAYFCILLCKGESDVHSSREFCVWACDSFVALPQGNFFKKRNSHFFKQTRHRAKKLNLRVAK